MNRKPSRTTFRQRLNEMVSSLRESIITGSLQPGDYLPAETILAEQFNLSKNSVRKGLELLVAEALIEKVPRIGNRICSLNDEASVTINLGYYSTLLVEARLSELLTGFYKRFPNIRVKLIPIDYRNFSDTIPDYFENGYLDVVSINYQHFLECMEGGYEPIFEPLEADNELYPFLTRAFVHQGSLLVQPLIASPVILCYNKDHFLQYDIPEPDSSWTWEAFMHHASRLSHYRDQHGFHFHLQSNNRWPVFLLQSGMTFVRNDKGAYDFEDKRLWEGLDMCSSIMGQQGVFPAYLSENDADSETLFVQEKVSIIMATYFSLNWIKDAGFQFDVAPLPYLNQAKTLLLNIGLAVNKHSKYKDAALKLSNYLLSYEAQLQIRQRTLSIPSHKRAAEWQGNEIMYRPSRFHMYRDIIPTFSSISELGLPMREIEILKKEVKFYWSKLESKQELCKKLEEAF